MEIITATDRAILRELARKQLEYAHSPQMEALIPKWYAQNDTPCAQPLVQIELWTFDKEIVPPRLRCETDTARAVERGLYYNFLNHELFGDDFPVPSFYAIGWHTWFDLFDAKVETEHAVDSGGSGIGYRFNHIITDIETDVGTLKPSAYGVDREGTLAEKAWLEDIFGDILPVRLRGGSLFTVPTYDVVRLMGLEAMMIAMYEEPDAFHQLMRRITDEYAAFESWLEREGLLLPSNGHNSVGQGTWGFTQKLPGSGDTPVSLRESWGHINSQESVGISPDMYGEFVFPYYKETAARYGLLSYGCCEPVHTVWEKYLSTLPNMRKISISPWCDEEYMGEQLRGKDIVYHRKPSPNYLGVGAVFDEEGFTEHIVNTVKAARGCSLEITMRDIYSINYDIPKVRKAIEIIRAAVEKYYY